MKARKSLRSRSLWSLLLISFTFGCGHSFFTDPKTNPIIEDKVGIAGREVLGTLATTAERRTVIVKLTEKNKASDIGKFCAEPSPDVAENIISQVRFLLEAQANLAPPAGEAGGGGKFGADLNKLIQTAVQMLVNRSQGLQLYRDGMYNYCQAYLNGAFKDDNEYQAKLDELLRVAYQLMYVELHLNKGKIPGTEIINPPEYKKPLEENHKDK